MMIKHDEGELNEQLELAAENEHGSSQWPGMTYEQGVANTLRWVLELDETPPMEDEG